MVVSGRDTSLQHHGSLLVFHDEIMARRDSFVNKSTNAIPQRVSNRYHVSPFGLIFSEKRHWKALSFLNENRKQKSPCGAKQACTAEALIAKKICPHTGQLFLSMLSSELTRTNNLSGFQKGITGNRLSVVRISGLGDGVPYSFLFKLYPRTRFSSDVPQLRWVVPEQKRPAPVVARSRPASYIGGG